MSAFQTRAIKFPNIGYFAFIWLKIKNAKSTDDYPFLLQGLNYTETEAIKSAKKLMTNSSLKDKVLKDSILIAKVKFFEFVPLKKEFWTSQKTVAKYSDYKFTLSTILDAFKDKSNKKVLVVPQGFDSSNKEILASAYSFKNTKDREIEKFMKGSNAYVDPTAKEAALYNVMTIYGLNLATGQKIKNGISYWEN